MFKSIMFALGLTALSIAQTASSTPFCECTRIASAKDTAGLVVVAVPEVPISPIITQGVMFVDRCKEGWVIYNKYGSVTIVPLNGWLVDILDPTKLPRKAVKPKTKEEKNEHGDDNMERQSFPFGSI